MSDAPVDATRLLSLFTFHFSLTYMASISINYRLLFRAILLLIISTMPCFAEPSLWDVEWAKSAPLEVEVKSEATETVAGVALILRELRYTSHEWKREKIQIAGHLAMPESAKETPLPGWLNVTGDMNAAKAAAVQYHVVALSIDRVGSGQSTGPRDHYLEWLDVEAEPKNGWMYHYVMAAIRGVTYLQTLPEVKPDAIGITGTSRGGICTMLANAVDARIKLAVPVAATGDMMNTAAYTDNWIVSIFLKEGEKTKDSQAFKTFHQYYDPLNSVQSSHGAVFLINGAQDEFFPITSTRHVFNRIHSDKRLEVVYDCDHGYYGNKEGRYDSYNNGVEIFRRLNGCLKKAVAYWLHGKGVMPQTPAVSLMETDPPLKLSFAVQADDSDAIRTIRFIYSTDASYTYRRSEVNVTGDRVVPLELKSGEREKLVYFVEVEYMDGYYLTSAPQYAEGLEPKIRPAPH